VAEGAASPRLVAEVSREDGDDIRQRAKEIGFADCGPFVVEASPHAYLLPAQLRLAIAKMAATDGLIVQRR